MGMFLGLVFGLELAAVGDLLPYPRDSFVFIIYISLVVWVLSVFITSMTAIIYFSIARFFQSNSLRIKVRRLLFALMIFIFFMSQGLLIWFELNRPIYLWSMVFIIGLTLTLIVSIILAIYLSRFWVKHFPGQKAGQKRGFLKKMRFSIPVYFLALLIVLVIIGSIVSNKPTRKEKLIPQDVDAKILFLGVDAANWAMLSPMIENGSLPNFEYLVKNGAHGPLPSLISLYNPFANTITHGIKSAAVWTSILTGKKAGEHGIKDFVYTEIPNIYHPFRYPLLPSFTPYFDKLQHSLNIKMRPYHRGMFKSKAAWHIYSEMGHEAAALGWWETWPAENFPGEILTDRFDDPTLTKRWFPPTFISQAEVMSVLKSIKEPDPEELAYFTSYSFEPKYLEIYAADSREYMRNDLLKNLVQSYYKDKFRSETGLRLMNEHEYTFMSVYFYGLDTAGHAFWRFMEPDLFKDVEQEEITWFGNIIPKYYQFVDNEIGKYLNMIDDKTTVVIVSDHGMGPWLGARLTKKGVRLSGSHRRNGIIILYGKNINKGAKIHPKNLLDVLPTMLYISGLPIAKDMAGNVIEEAIEPLVLAKRPIKYISTYETERYEFDDVKNIIKDISVDKNQLEQLRALGYIK